MKFPIWLTTSVIALGILIPPKVHSETILDVAEQNDGVYTLARHHKHRRFRGFKHGSFDRRRRSRRRFHRNRAHFPDRHGRTRHRGRHRGRHHRPRGFFIRF